MKMSPQYIKAQANMQPGVITSSGFLGDDERPLVDIIGRDEEAFTQFGIDFETVAQSMRKLLREGRKGLGEPITVDAGYRVQVNDARGFLACPFEDGIYRKTNAVVEHLASGKILLYSELSLHLLEKHHFLQGIGSPFRLEPRELKTILGL